MSGYLLDTNVISALAAPAPDDGVVTRIRALREPYLSVVTIHELIYGVERLPQGRRRDTLSAFVEAMLSEFSARILPVSVPESRSAGALRAARQATGQPMDIADALIAATALVHGLTVVTRNTKDFVGAVPISNPFDPA